VPRKCWRGLRRYRSTIATIPHAGADPAAEDTPAEGSPIGQKSVPRRPDRAGGVRIPSLESFRVLFVIRPGVWDAACMRYRGYNVIEALRRAGVEAAHLDDRHIPERLAEALSYDLIVLVRRQMTREIALLLEGAVDLAIPVVCDLDDYLFDDEVIPYIEMLRQAPIDQARRLVWQWREVPERCQFFTGSTSYLTERVATLGKRSYLIRNAMNEAQLALSRTALEKPRDPTARDRVRLGYFSGTRTHQDDFRQIAAVLVRLMDEFPAVDLVVAGDFDLAEFPDFGRFPGRVEQRPFVDWRRLPAEIARVHVNLIPLEVNPFTEGKSNLKYYEAAVLKVPSVATPARAYTESITHGVNGFLADNDEQWYAALRALVLDPGLRQQIGERAYRHALREYVPSVVAAEALGAYREMLRQHRRCLGVPDDAPTVAVLLSDVERALVDRAALWPLCAALVQFGASLTIHIPESRAGVTAAPVFKLIADHGFASVDAVQVGTEVPCCDLLLATDAATAQRAKRFAHRARTAAWLVSEYEPAHLHPGVERERAQRSYHLGLELLAVDPAVADLLVQRHGVSVQVLPPWLEAERAALCEDHDPRQLLVAATSSLPDEAWNEAVAALERIGAAHPDVSIALCGAAAQRGESAGLPYRRLPRLGGDDFADLIAERPVCVVLYPSGMPVWVYDLLAQGCPVVRVAACRESLSAEPELSEGFVTAPADAMALAGAIESLLVDRIRMSILTYRGAERVRAMPDATEAARMLLRALATAGPPALNPYQADARGSSRPASQVACLRTAS
jgi:glycosyltransferase involved in cell wall biosynthesis